MPKITVLIPVFNGEKYIHASIDSILNQTFADFELLIIDDGSTDSTSTILSAVNDDRIRVHRTKNAGVAAALNLGVTLAKGKYIARMDADDLAHRNRLSEQFEVLEQFSNIGIVSSLARQIDSDGHVARQKIGNILNNLEMKWGLIWKNQVIHPSVMMRKSALVENELNYSLEHNKAEDFELWNQLAQVTDIAVINKPLLDYRVHQQSVTGSNVNGDNKVQQHLAVFTDVVNNNLCRLGLQFDETLVYEIAIISGGTAVDPRSYNYLELKKNCKVVLTTVENAFCKQHQCDPNELSMARASQLTEWSRNMIATSKLSALKILLLAIILNSNVLRFPGFYKVIGLIVIPGLNRAKVK